MSLYQEIHVPKVVSGCYGWDIVYMECLKDTFPVDIQKPLSGYPDVPSIIAIVWPNEAKILPGCGNAVLRCSIQLDNVWFI